MKISRVVEILEDLKDEHGDLHVVIYSNEWVHSRAGSYKREWHGTIQGASLDERNENQIFIVTTN